ncbi:MAG: hypothetical protein AAGI07_11355 [Bacteroidota bacterium]
MLNIYLKVINRRLLFFFFLVFFFTTSIAFAQFYDESDDDLLYRREFVYGLNFNTNGGLLGGLMFKHARVINKFMFHSFSLEIVNVKHPKEIRTQSPATGSSYVNSKRNYLYVIRPQYGREIVLFQKAKEQGVQVNWITAIGPGIGIVAPYLIDYNYDNDLIRTEQFDSRIHIDPRRILGTGRFTESLSQAKIQIAGSFKTSLSFEFGTFKNNVTGFEAGFMLDAFTNEIEIIADGNNRSIYSSAFLTFFYGIRK